MNPADLVRYLNGTADSDVAMKAAWALIGAMPGFDPATTDLVLLDLGGPAIRPVAFFDLGGVIELGEDGRWAVDESGRWSGPGIEARYDPTHDGWAVTTPV